MRPSTARAYSTVVQRVIASLKGEARVAVTSHDVCLDRSTYPWLRSYWAEATGIVLLTSGLHGDEPAGVEALCEFLEQRRYRRFVGDWELTVLPCLNPWGYEHGRRENQQQKDLNREFKSSNPPQEVVFAQAVLDQG
jgi:murein peptide amidase A